jgi:hypothetical protein
MNTSNLSLVPLRQASLCLDCETITTAHANCHACGSQALLNVARALDRRHPSDLAWSMTPVVVQMSSSHVRQRDTYHRGTANPERSRGRELGLSRGFDVGVSENSA